jgi:hypothetical protein
MSEYREILQDLQNLSVLAGRPSYLVPAHLSVLKLGCALLAANQTTPASLVDNRCLWPFMFIRLFVGQMPWRPPTALLGLSALHYVSGLGRLVGCT